MVGLRSPNLFALVAGALSMAGCIEMSASGPEVYSDAGTPWHHQRHEVPLPGRLDVLFVIDDGPTMCQEQDTLAAHLASFTGLVERLVGALEVRVATVGATLDPRRGVPGALTPRPALPVPSATCMDQGTPHVPRTEDCQALVEADALPALLATGPRGNLGSDCDSGDLEVDRRCAWDEFERRLRCMVIPGTADSGPRQGLEAMRLALDCNGPNRALFGECCVEVAPGDLVYDPACRPAVDATPQFLDPEGVLMVVFVSDRDDCSGGDADGCGADALVPVAEYFEFLTRLKPRPLEQLSVIALVGQPAFTSSGVPIEWTDEAPLEGCAPGDTDDRCCPDGRCRGPEAPSCASAKGDAFAGDRYIEFADAFEHRRACTAPPAQSPDAAAVQVCAGLDMYAWCAWPGEDDDRRQGRCMPMEGGAGLACAACPTICEDDYGAALDMVRSRVAPTLVAGYCLDVAPPCVVQTDDGARRCASAEDRAVSDNHPVRVRLTCPEAHAAYCAGTDGVLDRRAWSLELDVIGCPHGSAVSLDEPAPPGSAVHIEFPLAVQ